MLSYLVLIPFEIYVSATLLAAMLPPDTSPYIADVLAYSLFFIVVVYSSLGGLRGVISTDKVQFAFIITMFVVILLGINTYPQEYTINTPKIVFTLPDGDFYSIGLLAISSFIAAVSTQIYSITNLSMGTNFDLKSQVGLYRWTGLFLFLAYIICVAIGIGTMSIGTTDFASIDILLSHLSKQGGGVNHVIIFLIVFGMVAALLSSADSGMVSIAQTAYDNLFGKDSFSVDGDRKKLLTARLGFVFMLNSLAALPLIVIFKIQPNLVALLLASLSGLTVSAPFIVSGAFNLNKRKTSLITNLGYSTLAIIIIIAVWVTSISAVLNGNTTRGNYVVIIGFCLGLIFCIMDYFYAKKMTLQSETL